MQPVFSGTLPENTGLIFSGTVHGYRTRCNLGQLEEALVLFYTGKSTTFLSLNERRKI
jgi:hypothetical protein